MHLIISATFIEKGPEFIDVLKAAASNIGLDLDVHFTHTATYVSINEPMKAAEPVAEPDIPAEPVAEPEIAMSVELPDVPPIAAELPPEMPPEVIAVPDEPVAEPVTEPAVDLEKEPAMAPATDCGMMTIVSLTSAIEVPTCIDPNLSVSQLEVPSDIGQVNGLLSFWYGGIEFTMPPAIDNNAVSNANHELKFNTIRIVLRRHDGEMRAMLVDLVRGDVEKLNISGIDAATVEAVAAE